MYHLVPRLSSACSKETDRVRGFFLLVQEATGRSGQMMTYQEEELCTHALISLAYVVSRNT